MTTAATAPSPYPPIGDYALIGDCHAAALVSRTGSIDWCCLPRFDQGSCFGRLLDWEKGGFCSIGPAEPNGPAFRRYIENTMVLETLIHTNGGEARILDCFAMREGGRLAPYLQILRIVEGVRGRVDLRLQIAPRFDYGALRPWIRHEGINLYSAIGGDDALVIHSDAKLEMQGRHDLTAHFMIRAGERIRTTISYADPAAIDRERPTVLEVAEIDRRLLGTIAWWQTWAALARLEGPDGPGAVRSALTLKALTNAPTGAIVAAPTTSLPERPGGERNWDYRYSWIRDSALSVRSLADIGCATEADDFRRFIQRSAAGAADSLQIMYGPGGERTLTEIELAHLEGYRGARPVRVGNAAAHQTQLDAYGELLDLSWRWYERGHSIDDDYWRFLLDLVDTAAERWEEADRGIWEIRGKPQHFVHSKVYCWAALDRGIRLAEASLRQAPLRRWKTTRNAIRDAIERDGYDKERGIFVQAFGSQELDAALLLLPSVDFVAYDDERMIRTVDAIRQELLQDGLLLRYRVARTDDGLKGEEGVFLACSFWLAECLAHQGRMEEAREVFDRASATGNDLGLFAEEWDSHGGEMLGNFPQGLTHLSHIAAAVALAQRQGYDITTESGKPAD
ncbi:MAG TPA: glycoside hydrolase family 15 protein [Thermomicrobiales bacterium]